MCPSIKLDIGKVQLLRRGRSLYHVRVPLSRGLLDLKAWPGGTEKHRDVCFTGSARHERNIYST